MSEKEKIAREVAAGGGVVLSQEHKLVLRTQHGKGEILAALELKKLKGSVVLEKVNCGKPRCHKCQSGGKHGPYPYLHYYSSGKVKRRYLSKRMAQLLFQRRVGEVAQNRECA